MDAPPRLVPHRDFPSYSYVPGKFPHPITDPNGHSYGKNDLPPPPLDPEKWQDNEEYLYGIDLFNHGFYWEAHEAWEGLWIACGRTGVTADFLKGLIKLAAAGVKVREKKPIGIERHLLRAAELFRHTQSRISNPNDAILGLQIGELIESSESLATQSQAIVRNDRLFVPILTPIDPTDT